ncbi:MAG: hypothetical protein IPQ07_10985 [Myxococcales bacterium]|nr:hypothetical protein [Myxococcales bacterium]
MWRRVDDVLRFIYVLLSPAMIVALGMVVPIGGIMISAGLATAIALTGSTQWILRVSTLKLIGKPLAKFAKLGEYYRVHTPRPLLYYVLFPVLFPYWLFKRTARQEFLAYKRIGALALIVTIGGTFYDYFHNWVPLPRKYFFGALFSTFVLQLLITFMFVMPIVTTLIVYQRKAHRKSIATLLVLGLVLGGAMFATMRQVDQVSFAVQARVRARIKWQPEETRAAMVAALDAGLASQVEHRGDFDAAREAARKRLEPVFHADEARAFHLISSDGVVMIYAKTRNHELAWSALALRTNKTITSAADLPPELREQLGLPATASAWP